MKWSLNDLSCTNYRLATLSGAVGATGFCAVQILKNLGLEVIGCAGNNDKVKLLESMGVKAFNYKTEKPLDALLRLCPNGLDIYFDNVGGEILEAALEVMNDFGRVIACGSISGYDQPMEKMYGVRNLFHVVAKRITFQGFVTDLKSFTQKQFTDAATQLAQWLKSGQLKDTFTVVDGFERTPEALMGLFSGRNTGKMMVRCELPSELASVKLKVQNGLISGSSQVNGNVNVAKLRLGRGADKDKDNR